MSAIGWAGQRPEQCAACAQRAQRKMLRGLKEIANHIEDSLGVRLDVSEVCRYSKWSKGGLPLLPASPDNRKQRAVAWSDEVEAWCIKNFRIHIISKTLPAI